jgi:hypothetical protein
LSATDKANLLPAVTVGEAIGDLPRLEMGEGSEIVGYTAEPRSDYALSMRNPEGVTFNHFGAKLAKQNSERMKYVKPGGSWRDIPHRLLPKGSPVFLDDKAVVPLQAADMAAWHLRRRKDRPNEDVNKWPTAPLLGLVHCEVHIPKAALQLTADQMKEVPGLALVPNKPDRKFKAALQQILRDAKF